jgi:hypothetical protein
MSRKYWEKMARESVITIRQQSCQSRHLPIKYFASDAKHCPLCREIIKCQGYESLIEEIMAELEKGEAMKRQTLPK